MEKPRLFLGSSAKQEKLLQALTRGLADIATVEPWMTSFNPGTSTLERLIELTREVDFAAFVFAQDDWTTKSSKLPPSRRRARRRRATTSCSPLKESLPRDSHPLSSCHGSTMASIPQW